MTDWTSRKRERRADCPSDRLDEIARRSRFRLVGLPVAPLPARPSGSCRQRLLLLARPWRAIELAASWRLLALRITRLRFVHLRVASLRIAPELRLLLLVRRVDQWGLLVEAAGDVF